MSRSGETLLNNQDGTQVIVTKDYFDEKDQYLKKKKGLPFLLVSKMLNLKMSRSSFVEALIVSSISNLYDKSL